METIRIIMSIILLIILPIISIIINNKNKILRSLEAKSGTIIEKNPKKRYNIVCKKLIKSFNKRRKI